MNPHCKAIASVAVKSTASLMALAVLIVAVGEAVNWVLIWDQVRREA